MFKECVNVILLYSLGLLPLDKFATHSPIISPTQESLKSTFDMIIPNCVPDGFTSQGHPGPVNTEIPFQFFNQLMNQIKSAVNDDRTLYAPLITRQAVCS